MRNPFTLLADGFNSTFTKHRSKIEGEVSKVKDTKKETGRSKSGGGSITAKAVSNDKKKKDWDTGTYYGYLRDDGYNHSQANGKCNGVKKRRTRNKIARKSRRINRLKAA